MPLAAANGALQLAHVVFGLFLFLALAAVCLVRGVSIQIYSMLLHRPPQPAIEPAAALAPAT